MFGRKTAPEEIKKDAFTSKHLLLASEVQAGFLVQQAK